MDAFRPPAWAEGGDPRFLLGTDDQGRDMLSTIIYGLRISLLVGFGSVILAAADRDRCSGLVGGYVGGLLDAVVMRVADVQLTFPAILIALLIDGIAARCRASRARGPRDLRAHRRDRGLALGAASRAPCAARPWSSATRNTCRRPGSSACIRALIMLRHVLPNVLGPVLVIATISLALAIITEATLSFLGVGVPPTQPSLGTLIRIGNDFLFSGEWWITIFPGAALVLLVLAVNLLGDWLRDALNPRLR